MDARVEEWTDIQNEAIGQAMAQYFADKRKEIRSEFADQISELKAEIAGTQAPA